MQTKGLEIRDRATFIAVMATKVASGNAEELFLTRRCGFAEQTDQIIVMRTANFEATYDPFQWTGSRTMKVAHQYIIANFDTLVAGDVIDVEYILGETTTPKLSESSRYA